MNTMTTKQFWQGVLAAMIAILISAAVCAIASGIYWELAK